ncbi:MAG TPA: biotin carboxylase N-terminal domain-containing protein [Streptosporangiaceae bacterium]|nr:biotin carboxylase N-terminal domain-containing protein [Streptosporangiaceae bacterium]
MITTLLIANRGEIARRILRTAAAMGIRTVAVYAEGDAGAPFVTEADRAVALPGRTAAQTYLNIDALLEAAAAAGADAVHPGYGFLSERADFARAVTAVGLTWVGPPAEVIETMGDKLAAKRLLADVGVPVLESWEVTGDGLPGLSGVRLPLIVKAAMGGGGKGMRVVGTHAELAEAVGAAGREATAAFGDGTVFLERYITDARHVEIQVLADAHGGLVHCFERECSIQRRHQKIIEECPSPAVGPGLRERMGAAALAAAKAVGYLGAGTVEFVLEPSGDFWFLEVNTRLQVEHPVTEAVTGVDLVREQLLVAQGLPLSVTQDGLAIDGHAIEARLYAEDPAAGFLPATGTLVDWCPATAPPCRWDAGVTAGSVAGVEFDPMLAKVIAHAPTRGEAALALALALQRSRIRGVTTNRDFLVAALRHPDFLAGRTTTSFIERSAVPLARRPSPAELRTAAIGAALAAQAAARAAAPVLATLPSGWRNSVMPPERAEYRHGPDTVVVSYARQRDGRFAVTVTGPDPDGEPGTAEPSADGPAATSAPDRAPAPAALLVTVHHAGDGWIDLGAGGQRHRLHVLAAGDRVWVQGPEGDVALTAVPRFPDSEGGEAVAGGLVAPMPGTVLAVHVAAGDTVAQGQLLMIVEAMKMEHRITAPRAGAVGEVRARPGDQVNGGDLLAVLDEAI